MKLLSTIKTQLFKNKIIDHFNIKLYLFAKKCEIHPII